MIRTCENCSVPFNAIPAEVRRGYGRFCSRSCSTKKTVKRAEQVTHICRWCGKDFLIAKSRSIRGLGVYCSHPCLAAGGNRSRADRMRATVETRFWSRVVRADGGGCWLWTGSSNEDGYGHLGVHGRRKSAHRFSYELTNGPIEAGRSVLHRCDNPPCVRPDHLFLGTQADNVRDMVSKGRAPPKEGARNPNAKLSDDQVIAIRAAVRRSVADLGHEFGVTGSQICKIRNRKQRNDIP